MTRHAIAQLSRLVSTPAARCHVTKALAARIPEVPNGKSAAIHLLSFLGYYGTSTTSNGNQLWAIVRDGQTVTIMLRRITQQATPAVFGVDILL